jgi:hypothetical protein
VWYIWLRLVISIEHLSRESNRFGNPFILPSGYLEVLVFERWVKYWPKKKVSCNHTWSGNIRKENLPIAMWYKGKQSVSV